MGSKYTAGRPPTNAAPIYLDSSGPVGDALPYPGEASHRHVTYGDLSREVRRQLNVSKFVPPAGASDTTSVTQPLELTTSDRIVRLPELLAIFQISRTTAYAWQKAGRLPRSVALGPRARGWKLSDITRFLASLGTEARDD